MSVLRVYTNYSILKSYLLAYNLKLNNKKKLLVDYVTF